MAITVQTEFGYVGIVVVASFLSHLWMSVQVTKARTTYKVPYPTLYAVESENKDAKLFNCVQRGHQNFLENVPFFFALLIFAGLQHPIIASVAGLFFLVGRIVYFVGYSSGNPKKRSPGAGLAVLSLFTLVGCVVSFVVHSLM